MLLYVVKMLQTWGDPLNYPEGPIIDHPAQIFQPRLWLPILPKRFTFAVQFSGWCVAVHDSLWFVVVCGS